MPPPNLLVVKSARHSGTDDAISTAIPGQVITYSVQVFNTGAGPATAVVLSDRMSPYTAWGLNSFGAGIPFQFVEGTPSSGLSLGTPVYSNDNGATFIYFPTSEGGGAAAGHDGTVTNWRIPMVGNMDAGGSFTLRYRVMVK
jgi:uncharacterized repeat protein (TIGR01451 family)